MAMLGCKKEYSVSNQLAFSEISRYYKVTDHLEPIISSPAVEWLKSAISVEIHNGKIIDSTPLDDFFEITEQAGQIIFQSLQAINAIINIKHTGSTPSTIIFNIKHNCQIIEEINSSNIKLETTYTINEHVAFIHNLLHAELAGVNRYLTHIIVKNNANYTSNILNINCQELQILANIDLNGNEAQCDNQILNYAINQNNLDILLLIAHNSSNTNSQTIAHAVAQDHATSSILGKIYVKEHSNQVNADLQIKNLLDSKYASCNSRPQLEIYSNDVKCSHGSTSGSLNRDALYYMQSRGIDPELAKNLLRGAFIKSIMEKLTVNELKTQIYKLLQLSTI
jgi:Fe-S cluster assembly scaffold protein SufB